jgi:hypothetical protein
VTEGGSRPASLTLYRGVTVEDPVEGMFSFVPAGPGEVEEPRFEGPAIELPGLVKPSVWRGSWGTKRELPLRAC